MLTYLNQKPVSAEIYFNSTSLALIFSLSQWYLMLAAQSARSLSVCQTKGPRPLLRGAAQQKNCATDTGWEALPGRATPPVSVGPNGRVPECPPPTDRSRWSSLPYQEVAVGLTNWQNGPGQCPLLQRIVH